MPCSWCGVEVGIDEGFRASEPEGERKAAFCRLEHVVPWAIQGAHWEPGHDPAARRARRRPGPLRALRRPAGRPPRPARPPPRRAPRSPTPSAASTTCCSGRRPGGAGRRRARRRFGWSSAVRLWRCCGAYSRIEGRGRSLVAGALVVVLGGGVARFWRTRSRLGRRPQARGGLRPNSAHTVEASVAHPRARGVASAATAATSRSLGEAVNAATAPQATGGETLRPHRRPPRQRDQRRHAARRHHRAEPRAPAPRLRDRAGDRAAAGGAQRRWR